MALTMGRSAMLKEVQGEFGIDGQLENAVWDKSFSLKGLQVWQKRCSKPYQCHREYKKISTPVATLRRLLESYQLGERQRWDPQLIESELIEELGPNERVVRQLYPGSSLHRNREFLVFEAEVEEDGKIYFLRKSLDEHPKAPKKAKLVRVDLQLSGFMIWEVEGDPMSTNVAFLQRVDYKLLHTSLLSTEQAYDPILPLIEQLVQKIQPLAEAAAEDADSAQSRQPMSSERKVANMQLARRVTQIRKYVNEDTRARWSRASSSALINETRSSLSTVEGEFYVSFNTILEDALARMYFARFLETEYNSETLEFYNAVECFRDAYDSMDNDELLAEVQLLTAKYIKDGSPRQVNLSQQTRDSIIQSCTSNEDRLPLTVLDLAQRAVVDLMLHDPYRRFLETEYYADMLENLNAKSGNVSKTLVDSFIGLTREYDRWELIDQTKDKSFQLFKRTLSDTSSASENVFSLKEMLLVAQPLSKVKKFCADFTKDRQSWDMLFKSGRDVEMFDANTSVMHCLFTPPLKGKVRDFSVMRLFTEDLNGDVFILLKSVVHQKIPTSEDLVRGTFQLTGFQLSPVDDTHTQITYISQIDWDLDCAKLAKLAKKLTVLPKLAKILAKSKK